jgi:hypothetical protein
MKRTWFPEILALAALGGACGSYLQGVHPDELSAQGHRQQAAQVSESGGFGSSERRIRHAQEHLAAAAYLEDFEEAECRDLPSATRSACPLIGSVAEIADVPGGVRLWFADKAPVDATLAHMRCHFAYAQTTGFQSSTTCPLYVRGIEISRASDPRAIDIASKDAKTAVEIRKRVREEVPVVGGGGKRSREQGQQRE